MLLSDPLHSVDEGLAVGVECRIPSPSSVVRKHTASQAALTSWLRHSDEANLSSGGALKMYESGISTRVQRRRATDSTQEIFLHNCGNLLSRGELCDKFVTLWEEKCWHQPFLHSSRLSLSCLVYVYVCMRAGDYVCVCVLCECIRLWDFLRLYSCLSACLCARASVSFICLRVCVWVYIYCVRVHGCVCVISCVCVCLYTFVFECTKTWLTDSDGA